MAGSNGNPRSGVRTLAWLRPAQGPLVRAIAARAGLTIETVGGPSTAGRGGAAHGAEGFEGGGEWFSDLRQALTACDAELVLLAAPLTAGSVGEPADEERGLLALLRSKEWTVVTLEPLPGAAARAPVDATSASGLPVIVPLLRDAPALRAAREALENFGPARTLTVSMRTGPGAGSLAARLFDAALLVHTLLGEPDAIDASVVTPVAASGVHEAPPASIDGLHGDLTANIRFAGARAASFSLSDRGGRWFRGLTLIGEGGCLRLDESGFDLLSPTGGIVDSTRLDAPAPLKSDEPGVDPGAASAFAEAIRRALDPRASVAPPVDLAAVLSIAEAALLSARTGQGESPATILRMARSA
ncbi:MAG TPA: hypothetical protein DEB06_09815 [Phycisphaerales bacterium]|nr:hypothetical protein [Phycisphaerales bacterium]